MRCRNLVDGNVVWFGSAGKNDNGTSKKNDSFVSEQQSVISSLTQRLSVIRSELWYNVSYGLPLFDKVKNKIAIDATIAQIVESHPDVLSVSSFDSKIEGKSYHCKFQAETKYGSIELSI